MLCITRQPGEMIYIGDNIEIRVLEVKGNRVRLAIKAPDGVRIVRAEKQEGPCVRTSTGGPLT